MKRWNRAVSVAVAALLVGRLGSGCAEDGSVGILAATDDSGVDAPMTIPIAPDGGDDVADDASVEAEAPTCSADGWCYTPLPSRESIDAGPPPEWGPDTLLQMNSVWVAPDKSTWAVTQAGHVLRWDGATWTVLTNIGQPLYSIWGSSTTDLWIGGANALVLRGAFDAGQLTLERVATDLRTAALNLRQGAKKIWGTSATDIWILGEYGGVFHLEPSPDGGLPAFIEMDLPTDFPGPDYIGPFWAGALWGTANEVWVAGVDDRYYCYPDGCRTDSEFVVRKWKGGNDGDSSWDRIRILREPQAVVEPYARIRMGVSTTDGLQVVIINGGATTYALRIANSDSQLGQGIIGIQHDGPYAWTIESVPKYVAPEAIWATSGNDVWLVGTNGIRHFDGDAWQIGRLSLVPGVPLLRTLRAIGSGPIGPTGALDLWSVGDDVAIHRVVMP